MKHLALQLVRAFCVTNASAPAAPAGELANGYGVGYVGAVVATAGSMSCAPSMHGSPDATTSRGTRTRIAALGAALTQFIEATVAWLLAPAAPLGAVRVAEPRHRGVFRGHGSPALATFCARQHTYETCTT